MSPSSSSVLVTITSTSVSLPPQSTSDTQLSSSTDVPQPTNAIRLPSESEDSGSSNSQKAGQIAGGTIGSIAAVGLIFFAIWLWRRHRNRHSRFSRMLPDETRYLATQPPHPGKARSPSSIMNQLMTAAYEAEDGVDYRDSEQIFDNYANEKKKSYAAPENQNMEDHEQDREHVEDVGGC
ncbi:hypothetical protein NUW58_g5347 [Xylaria curta]|uniref:Uncharacterized protein n=1 Tax=Xylaria curta TaxID=42375 RepID=A0ACC1P4P2_9PEZI|nr:hypothetical protein NUW58_g5347 [Xylaria curta]